ncbi:MAG: protein RecA [Sedimentibacter sp.]|nr:protein RecA [Sedimentibacter sp.]
MKKGDEVYGNRTRVKVVKNKVAPPFKQAEFDIIYGKGISKEGCILDMAVEANVVNKAGAIYGKGISKEGCILDMAVEANVVNKAGAWYSYESNRIGQGRENSKEFLLANPQLMEEIEKKVREKFEMGDINLSSDDAEKNANDLDD